MIARSHRITRERETLRVLSPLWFPVVALLFLVVSYAPYHHWDEYFYVYSSGFFSLSDLLAMETGLARGLFPPAFFSAKIGFVAFLDTLTDFTGTGLGALQLIQLVFAVLVLIFSGAAWLLLRELFGRARAQYITVTFLFMPLALYFGYKIFSELYSLIFVAIGCFAYLRTLSAARRSAMLGYGLAALLFLLTGVLCRFTSIGFFGGMVIGLFVLGDSRYPPVRNFLLASVMTILVVGLTLLFYLGPVGMAPAELAGLFGALQDKTPSIVMKIYALFMSVQFFFVPLFFILWRLGRPAVRFGLAWTLVCTLPFILVAKYIEPRYFYMAVLPLGILAQEGLLRLTSFLFPEKKRLWGWLVLLAAVVLVNRFTLFGLMIYEHDQQEYLSLYRELQDEYRQPTFLVPWVSDYAFLRFAFPGDDINLTWSPAGHETIPFFRSRAFLAWAGGEDRYVGSPAQLDFTGSELLYIGWRYNQPAVRLKRKILWLRNRYVNDMEASEGLKNHLTKSWIWASDKMELEPVLTRGHYEAFIVSKAE